MIDIEDHGPIRELRLARPPVNALSAALLARLEACLEDAVADGARAIVLSGRPGVFSAGLDLREVLGPDPDSLVRLVKAFYRVQERLARLPIPAVIAITGLTPEEIEEHGELPEGTHVMHKPADMGWLRGYLQAMLSMRASQKRQAPAIDMA